MRTHRQKSNDTIEIIDYCDIYGTRAHFYNLKKNHYLLGLQHLVVKDVRDAVPHHLQPAGAVGHHAAVPVHDVSCGDPEGVMMTSFIMRVKPIKTHSVASGSRVTSSRDDRAGRGELEHFSSTFTFSCFAKKSLLNTASTTTPTTTISTTTTTNNNDYINNNVNRKDLYRTFTTQSLFQVQK